MSAPFSSTFPSLDPYFLRQAIFFSFFFFFSPLSYKSLISPLLPFFFYFSIHDKTHKQHNTQTRMETPPNAQLTTGDVTPPNAPSMEVDDNAPTVQNARVFVYK